MAYTFMLMGDFTVCLGAAFFTLNFGFKLAF